MIIRDEEIGLLSDSFLIRYAEAYAAAVKYCVREDMFDLASNLNRCLDEIKERNLVNEWVG